MLLCNVDKYFGECVIEFYNIFESMVLNDTIKHCFYCEREFLNENYGTNIAGARTRDHIVPLSKNGRNHKSNMVYACVECNHFKADLLLELFIIKVQNYIDNNRRFKRIPVKNLPTIVANIKRLQEYILENGQSPHTQALKKPKKKSLVGDYFERHAADVTLSVNTNSTTRDYDSFLQTQTIEQFHLAKKHGYVIARLLTEPEPSFHEEQNNEL